MALIIPVSFKRCERDLWDWINEIGIKNFSPSAVCKKALQEKKTEWELQQKENPAFLKERLEGVKEANSKLIDFIDKKGLSKEWVKFATSDRERKPEKQIEKILEDKSKKKEEKQKVEPKEKKEKEKGGEEKNAHTNSTTENFD